MRLNENPSMQKYAFFIAASRFVFNVRRYLSEKKFENLNFANNC